VKLTHPDSNPIFDINVIFRVVNGVGLFGDFGLGLEMD
jgi:hypothetical protein